MSASVSALSKICLKPVSKFKSPAVCRESSIHLALLHCHLASLPPFPYLPNLPKRSRLRIQHHIFRNQNHFRDISLEKGGDQFFSFCNFPAVAALLVLSLGCPDWWRWWIVDKRGWN